MEVKGDWEFFANILRLPRWDTKAGICFMCRATKADVMHNGLDAEWRSGPWRLSHDDLLVKLQQDTSSPPSGIIHS